MATNVVDYTYIGPPMGNDVAIYRASYDYSVDGGASGVFNVFEASKACIVRNFTGVVSSAFTGSGMSLDAGTNTTADLYVDGRSVSSLTLNSTLPLESDAAMPTYLAAGGKISMSILGNNVTTGKIDFIVEIMKP